MHHQVRCKRSPTKLAPMSDSVGQGLIMLSFSHVGYAGETSRARSEKKSLTVNMERVRVKGQEAIRCTSVPTSHRNSDRVRVGSPTSVPYPFL